MAGRDKIKLFKFIREICHELKNFLSKFNQNPNSILFFIVQFLISTALYLVFEANSMNDYGFPFFTCLTMVSEIIYYSSGLSQMENILNYIENCEDFIEKSE